MTTRSQAAGRICDHKELPASSFACTHTHAIHIHTHTRTHTISCTVIGVLQGGKVLVEAQNQADFAEQALAHTHSDIHKNTHTQIHTHTHTQYHAL